MTILEPPTAVDPADPLAALQSLGLVLPSAAYIVGAIAFGLVGWAAWRHGKRSGRTPTRWLGLTLMLYPYAVSQTWLLYTVGAALCVGLWIDHR